MNPDKLREFRRLVYRGILHFLDLTGDLPEDWPCDWIDDRNDNTIYHSKRGAILAVEDMTPTELRCWADRIRFGNL